MEETFELVCQECSKIFDSEDINATICDDCWKKLMGENLENEGGQVLDLWKKLRYNFIVEN